MAGFNCEVLVIGFDCGGCHRLIDGRAAVTFLVALKNAMEDPTRLLIDL